MPLQFVRLQSGQERGIGNISLFYTLMACTLIISRRRRDGCRTAWVRQGHHTEPCALHGVVSHRRFQQIDRRHHGGGVVAALGSALAAAIQAMAMQTVAPLKRSVASNTIYIGIDLGFFLGPLIGSVIYDHTNYAFMFKVMSVPVALALVCFIIILPIHNRRIKALENDKRG
jgi:hypothetical protein